MIVVAYGSDIAKTAYDALAASDIGAYLKAGHQVSLKPNFVVAGPASNGAVTHPEVAEGAIRYLRDFGAGQIKIIESASIGVSTKRAFKDSGFEQLSRKYGVPLVDLKDSKCTILSHSGYDIPIYDEALETDFLLNLPVLKAHSQTRLTCCMKNLKGCIPDSEKRRFHTLGIHKPVAALNALIKTGYCVVDGICGDLSFEEGGNPVTANRIIAGRNPLTVDSFCAGLIGYRPDEIGYLSFGRDMGLGDYCAGDFDIVELGAESKPHGGINARSPLTADRYRDLIDERDSCSACYASLIHALHRMRGRAGVDGGKLHIGQGFKGHSGAGVGVGACTMGFDVCIKGCPPSARDIIEVLGKR